MDIIWYGQACFRLRDKSVVVVADPYDKSVGLKLPKLTADIVTVSHAHPGHSAVEAVKGEPYVVSSPGEYEVKGLFVTAIAMYHDAKDGVESGRNSIHLYGFADATVCHLGDLGHVPTQAQVEEMGNVDVLLVPVGGKGSLGARQAAEVISLIEPSIVVPMHYALPGLVMELDPLEVFLREMGLKEHERRESLVVSGKQLPEGTQVVILECRAG
jgi:L-ascorbate metabolism protein UlaG (beta-lactamase superfamily)